MPQSSASSLGGGKGIAMATQRTPAHDFYDEYVAPALEAWQAAPTDLRLAMAAAVSLYHVADYYWNSYSTEAPDRVLGSPSAGEFRARLADQSKEYALLRDVAESHKHMKLGRNTRVVTNASQTDVGATGYGEGPYGEGPYGGGPSIVIELDDGSKRHLTAIISTVEALWLSRLGYAPPT